jgi:hypothetical protein
MVQPELPLAYPKVRLIANRKKYELPLRWKAVFVLLLIYTVVLTSIAYVKATQTPEETSPVHSDNVQANAAAVPVNKENVRTNAETAPVSSVGGQVKMTATVPGWYDVVEIDNANILVKTNMKVWVNGREFIRCDDCGQRTTDPSLLDY